MSVPLRDYLIRDLITNEIQCDCFSYEVEFVLLRANRKEKKKYACICVVYFRSIIRFFLLYSLNDVWQSTERYRY